MSSISTALPSQTPQFQAVQAASKTDPSKTAATQTSPQQLSSGSAPNLKAQVLTASAKPLEGAHTRNPDGTFGAKHTLLPPGAYKKDDSNSGSKSSEAVSSVDVKI